MLLGGLAGVLGESWGRVGELLGTFWGGLGGLGDVLGRLETSWVGPGASWGAKWRGMKFLGPSWGAIWGPSWRSWPQLGHPKAPKSMKKMKNIDVQKQVVFSIDLTTVLEWFRKCFSEVFRR